MSECNTTIKVQDLCKKTAVEQWLDERNQLIVLYCKLTGNRNQLNLPNSQEINQFCDLLIDYVSAGHFEVYEKIVNACETNGPSSIQLLKKLYPQISETTDIVVNFNDKYANFAETRELKTLDNDLSLLGEAIAKRVELEDSLIETLNIKH